MKAKVGRRIHLAMMLFWGINMIGVWFVPAAWRIPYLVGVSIYANFVGHWSAYSAERPTEIEGDTNAS
jgi:hypothetical protein